MVRIPERYRRSSSRLLSVAAGAALLAGAAAAAATLGARPAPVQAPQAQPPQGQPTDRIIITGAAGRWVLPDCVPKRQDDPSLAACRTLTQVLRADLRFEDLFQLVQESLIAAVPPLNPQSPKFEDWKGIGAKYLIALSAEVANGELAVEARVYDVDTGQAMMQRRYSGKPDNPRIFAHQASDDIVALTQNKGVAKSRIVFVSDRDSTKERRAKELYIVDYDGFNPRRVTVNGSLNIVPAWRPDGQAIAYVSYRQGSPLIYLAKIFEGQSVANLTGEKGDSQAFSPAWSPDGKMLAFASNRAGNSDIYVAGADGSGARRLTTTQANDTAPCFSPTAQELAFTSNRTGTPQIWQMDVDGLNVRRLSQGTGNYNDGCAWNPAKQYSEIAFTARLESGGFDIAIIDLATRQVRQITEGRGSCEYPSWAPNGRHLVFSCERNKRWEITIADRDGRSLQTLATGPGNNVQPDWGP
jgi:TolB protein